MLRLSHVPKTDQSRQRVSHAVRNHALMLLAVFVWSALSLGYPLATAQAETRTLKMYFTHTKESATITFKKNGRYIPSGLKKANRFLRDWRRKEPTKMDPELLDLLWEVYQRSGSRKPIHVISGYRSPRTNNMLRKRGRNVAKTSQHTRGKAIDFFLPDVKVTKLRELGLKAHRGGVGYYRGSFVHLDTGRVRHWPRMSPKQLARVFPRGKTIHVPSNGKPMKGYKTAMANLKAGKNADGSRRKSPQSRSLLASIFRSSGNDGDEDESPANNRAKPKPKKPAAKPVAVASATVPAKPKPDGVDPFAVELNNAQNSRPPAETDATPQDSETLLASMPADKLAVPKLRPGARPAPAPAVELAALTPAPSAPGEAILATPPAASTILRPPAELGTSPAAPQQSDAELANLKSRLQTALARGRVKTAAERAVTLQAAVESQPQDARSLASIPTTVPVPRWNQQSPAQPAVSRQEIASIAKATQEQLAISRRLGVADDRASDFVKKASLQPESPIATAIPVSRNRVAAAQTSEIVTTPKPEGRVVSTRNEASVPVPKSPLKTRSPSANGELRFADRSTMPAELHLGDLDGRSVKSWAVASSTRVGPMATLTAPEYKRSTQRLAPSSVYSQGFADNRAPLRSDRFSGRSLTRVAFNYFGYTN
ncbi:MAG: DUF882 domain-containing protein [Pseudomonadota bacterium]